METEGFLPYSKVPATSTITVLNFLFYQVESLYVASASVLVTEFYSQWVSWTCNALDEIE
jgi:hypothetical protein